LLPTIPSAIQGGDGLKLHAAYRDQKLFVWGYAANQKKVAARMLPFAAPPQQLHVALSRVAEKLPVMYQRASIWMPTRHGQPIGGPTAAQGKDAIRPWSLSTAILDAERLLFSRRLQSQSLR
jgi:hypothetical protein